ncbi:RagB/SusD family nutrient uptake outer membrane protein [Fulvivirgaceae bacterium PWU4]|uniref:RagB/SusD family nutrient uptake outer membrane protein n=1 Tax=Chryseosolibacter histidini TaxID=2782349 RepID=A0AAP2GGU3_9BACT|nr:RagB/SusD family nutrient uptake outer membrane protein [Chryseosolibacter histidini]MBT1695304.1 RagB/SusD family nutrient uptake outer membrane protein [Chryseosolibacter histidini]
MITKNNTTKISQIMAALAFMALTLLPTACSDLLDQPSANALSADQFWRSEGDATTALMGAYSAVRQCFDRDYYFDGQGEFVYHNFNATASTNPYNGGSYNPSGYGSNFDTYFRYLYGAVIRTNYVVVNVEKMLPTVPASSVANLESIIGEARLLRALVYFRLISMWGDVPYFENVPTGIGENNAVFALMSRTPIATIKGKILEDLTYAYDKLPEKKPAAGRGSKPAALALRGKVQLFWGSWNKFGWPELSTFTPSSSEATAAYTAAADDFRKVINDFGLTLYRGGDPGQIDALGKADILPNYFYLFQPAASNDVSNTEFIMSFNHGTTGTGQGEELMRDFGTRTNQFAQGGTKPRFALADRYQSVTTGDFATPLIKGNPAPGSDANNTILPPSTPNHALNPQSYANRDYRMKATMMWNFEMILGSASLKSTGMSPFIYGNNGQTIKINSATANYVTVNADNNQTGYLFRKFIRNYAGQDRSDGDFSWPVIRLADVYLMYAEATNEVSGPQGDAIALVNKVRFRGNLPPLAGAKTADYASFFAAIEQERIVELVAEGQRSFDLRRWRAIERAWDPTGTNVGTDTRDTKNANSMVYFRNATPLTYQQCYIFRIPPGERDKNPNLTQNTPWL